MDTMQSVGAVMYKAINDADVAAIRAVIEEHPEERDAHTFMAGQTWLGYAAQVGKLASVKTLVDLGADINKGDRTYDAGPLGSACGGGHAAVAQYLVDHGAKLDTATSAANPLFASIVGRSPECVQVILRAGIDASVAYNTDTMHDMDAVAFAIMRGEMECAEIIARLIGDGNEESLTRTLARAEAVAERNAHA